MELFILSGVVVLLFATMVMHYVERGNLLIELAVRDEKITRLFDENRCLEKIALKLVSRDVE